MTPSAKRAADPTFLYGTAWKEDETRRLTALALEAGFTAIDTANQRRHYHEAEVGAALADHLAARGVSRESLFLQTKFTARGGQDHRLPYDPRADVATQVEQSFASSLEHLGTSYIDSFVLHGPSSPTTLTDEDWQAWQAMEGFARAGRTRFLGVSNVRRAQLEVLLAHAAVQPRFVQNRCYARRRWDGEVRALCASPGDSLSGILSPHGQPGDPAAWDGPEDRRPPRRNAGPGGLRVRSVGRDAATHRHSGQDSHGPGPRVLRARPRARRGRAPRDAVVGVRPSIAEAREAFTPP